MARLSQEQKAIIREKILVESKQLFLELGYDKTSTAKIAKSVGIAEGTIFNYFESKSEIFLEVLSEDISVEREDRFSHLDTHAGVTEVIYQFLDESLKGFLNLPKKLLKEIFGVLISVAKKRLGLLKKLADLDYKVMEDLETLLDTLVERGLLDVCDTKVCAETIYSAVMFEFMIYIYEEDRLTDDMLDQVKTKIEFIIKPYIKD